jgi:DMSO/TMAO reductase YedYZ molybdopterin-dependent catalytic subunit
MTLNRRGWLTGAGAALSATWLSACDRLNASPGVTRTLQAAEGLTLRAQRLVTDRRALAKEFSPADISTDFRANGSIDPQNADYLALKAGGFADWRLVIDGLVERPMSLTMAQLRAQPARTQITRHDCVEGWSSIGKWTGARLEPLIDKAGLKPQARFLVFHCADSLAVGGDKYYESIDLIDARHPQTILAYEMNDAPLTVRHGAPLRLRVERQLGYKHAKYLLRIEAVDSLEGFGQGKGGYWEDRGYEWYAGI